MRYLDDLGTRTPYSVIGLGTWQFGSWEWGYGERYDSGVARRLVRRAHELGVTLFDTAEMYGFGRSERILGEALDGIDRDRVVIATKIFPVLPIAPVVQQRAVGSARRLGVRRIDLYQVHQPNPLVRDGTTMRGMRALRDIGLIDEVGVSNYSLARWCTAETALGCRVLSNQVHFSLLSREPAEQLVPFAAQTGRVVIAYSPLEQGLLTGRYTVEHRPGNRIRALNPAFLPENLERVAALIGVLRDVADAHDATPSQIALAWVVHHPHVVAIPGASSLEQLEHNAAAADIALSDEEFAALTAAAQAYEPIRGLRALLRWRP
ncbi:MAG TPA: aldo/keto reductase [Pseudonocardiaceae bacterium]|jgi:aryl-alcohol dehydrogenase-like predicted oxidoreductase